jgi:nitrate reductase delta subunit
LLTEQQRILVKLVAIFLQYPNEDIKLELESLDQVVAELDDRAAKRRCLAFFSYYTQTPLLRLQEDYSRCFDLNPRTTLNLSYHKWGDGRQRGQALAKLQQEYLQAGYEPLAGELPDYLPLILEFLSVCPEPACLEITREYKTEVAALAGKLKADKSPYGALVEIVENLFEHVNGSGDIK